MNPGKELDKIIHKELMKKTFNFCVPSYSTDMTAAMQVVSYMRKRYTDSFSLQSPHEQNYDWFATFERKYPGHDVNDIYDWTQGKTAPHAICLASLEKIRYYKKYI